MHQRHVPTLIFSTCASVGMLLLSPDFAHAVVRTPAEKAALASFQTMLDGLGRRDKAGMMPTSPGFAVAPLRPPGVAEDALSALVNLGYRRPEAQPVVARVIDRLGDGAPLDAVLRDALRDLAQRAVG